VWVLSSFGHGASGVGMVGSGGGKRGRKFEENFRSYVEGQRNRVEFCSKAGL
jgi:hypothetical protein